MTVFQALKASAASALAGPPGTTAAAVPPPPPAPSGAYPSPPQRTGAWMGELRPKYYNVLRTIIDSRVVWRGMDGSSTRALRASPYHPQPDRPTHHHPSHRPTLTHYPPAPSRKTSFQGEKNAQKAFKSLTFSSLHFFVSVLPVGGWTPPEQATRRGCNSE